MVGLVIFGFLLTLKDGQQLLDGLSVKLAKLVLDSLPLERHFVSSLVEEVEPSE